MMRARAMHKMVTNSNGHVSGIMGGMIAIIGLALVVGLVVALFI